MSLETQTTSPPDRPPAPRRRAWRLPVAAALAGLLAGGAAVYVVSASRGARGRDRGGEEGAALHVPDAPDHRPGPPRRLPDLRHEARRPCRKRRSAAKAASARSSSTARRWTRSRPRHGRRKDEMGMDYLPVYEDEVQAEPARSQGLATVTIDPARQQLIGLRTAAGDARPGRRRAGARWRACRSTRPACARPTSRSTASSSGSSSTSSGRPVRQGRSRSSRSTAPSCSRAQNEYLLALQTSRTRSAKGGALAGDGDALVASARRKLELWDVPAPEIERLEQHAASRRRRLTFVSPIAGVVTAKNVVEGARVEPGDTPYEITDLGMVWVMADAYETRPRRRCSVGMPATLTLPAYPEPRPSRGRWRSSIRCSTRRPAPPRCTSHFANPSARAQARDVRRGGAARRPTREGLRIPADAVIRTGHQGRGLRRAGRRQVRAARGPARRRRSGDQVEVVSGLEAGRRRSSPAPTSSSTPSRSCGPRSPPSGGSEP